jgi:hypothetical protein
LGKKFLKIFRENNEDGDEISLGADLTGFFKLIF